MNRSLNGLLAAALLLSLLAGFLGEELVALRHRARPLTVEAATGPSVELEPGAARNSERPPGVFDSNDRADAGDLESMRTLPGEFEPQSALLLTCRELVPAMPDVFARIVSAAAERIAVIVLVTDDAEREFIFSTLDDYGLPHDAVQCVESGHDTMWIRDYGPVVARNPDGSRVVLDARYGDEERQEDDQVPSRIARFLGMRRIGVPVEIDGGNLLANGDGVCLSTLQIFVENDAPAREVRRVLATYYGCETSIFLEPLIGEDTGHVDMFATFTSRTTVVVGSYDRDVDSENAEVLDRNAFLLSQAETRSGPLRVVRVPMPARTREEWRTYTNVIYANGRLMIPVHADDDPAERKLAIATYSSLLPGWEMVAIDVGDLTGFGGALHCVSRNVEFAKQPGPSLDSAAPSAAAAPLSHSRELLESLSHCPSR